MSVGIPFSLLESTLSWPAHALFVPEGTLTQKKRYMAPLQGLGPFSQDFPVINPH